MIKLTKSGRYKLIETKNQIKILYLDRRAYAWINAENIGEILVISHNPHKTDCILAIGQYQLFEVSEEAELSDHMHLELAIGQNRWQGYLLLSGLPTRQKKRSRIIPTQEIVSKHLELMRHTKSTAKTAARLVIEDTPAKCHWAPVLWRAM